MVELNCRKLYEELGRLKELKAEFDRAYEEGVEKGDFSGCASLHKEMKELMGETTEIGKLKSWEVLRQLKLKEQYESQVEVARKSGLFGEEDDNGVVNRRESGRLVEIGGSFVPVIERGGADYPMPSWKEVRTVLRKTENLEIIKEKRAQGFTKMLIVPFAYHLDTMTKRFKEKVRELDQEALSPDGLRIESKGVFGANGQKIIFETDDPDYPVAISEFWDDRFLIYSPLIINGPRDSAADSRGGVSKDEVIELNGPWQICFVEEMPVIPEEGKTVGGRKQIDCKGSCIRGQNETPTIQEFHAAISDREKMADPDKYRYERGISCEQYLWMQLTSLLEKEKAVLMDYEEDEMIGTYLIDCYRESSRAVPYVFWEYSFSHFDLSYSQTDIADDGCGIRTSVNIQKT